MERNTTDLYKASINILGGCIIRDSFCTHENDGGYKVFRYVNLFSPMSLCEEAISIDTDRYENSDFSDYTSNFRKRCFYLDLTRDSVNFISRKKTDWLIIDCALFRKNLYQLGEKKLTCLAEAKDFLEFICKKKIIPPIVGEVCLDNMQDDEIEKRLHFYVDKLLELYPAEKIILLENKNAYLWCTDGKELGIFIEREELILEDKRMSKYFNLLKGMLKGCHVIPVPDNLIADSKHKFGKAPVHYTQEYYDYIFKAVECINERHTTEKEVEIIKQLCTDCSVSYMLKYYPLISKSYIELKYKYSHSKLSNLYISFKDLWLKYIEKKHKRY